MAHIWGELLTKHDKSLKELSRKLRWKWEFKKMMMKKRDKPDKKKYR